MPSVLIANHKETGGKMKDNLTEAITLFNLHPIRHGTDINTHNPVQLHV